MTHWRETTRTQLTPTEAGYLFVQAWGLPMLSAPELATLLAHSALETDSWRSMYGWNFGNEKATDIQTQDYQNFRNVQELINGQIRWFSPQGETDGKDGPIIGDRWGIPPGHPQTRFRWFPSASSGASAWIYLLRRKYSAALSQLADPVRYAYALHALGYFTARPESYAAALERLAAELRPVADLQTGVRQRPAQATTTTTSQGATVTTYRAGTYEFSTDAAGLELLNLAAPDLPGSIVYEPAGTGFRVLVTLDQDWTSPVRLPTEWAPGSAKGSGTGAAVALAAGVGAILLLARARRR